MRIDIIEVPHHGACTFDVRPATIRCCQVLQKP